MRKAYVKLNGITAGILEEITSKQFRYTYLPEYHDQPISLTMSTQKRIYEFKQFPHFFEGLLPEGVLLEAMLRKYKIDKDDYFGQLLQTGQDLVGAVTVEEIK